MLTKCHLKGQLLLMSLPDLEYVLSLTSYVVLHARCPCILSLSSHLFWGGDFNVELIVYNYNL